MLRVDISEKGLSDGRTAISRGPCPGKRKFNVYLGIAKHTSLCNLGKFL